MLPPVQEAAAGGESCDCSPQCTDASHGKRSSSAAELVTPSPLPSLALAKSIDTLLLLATPTTPKSGRGKARGKGEVDYTVRSAGGLRALVIPRGTERRERDGGRPRSRQGSRVVKPGHDNSGCFEGSASTSLEAGCWQCGPNGLTCASVSTASSPAASWGAGEAYQPSEMPSLPESILLDGEDRVGQRPWTLSSMADSADDTGVMSERESRPTSASTASISFHDRVFTKREADADLRCFTAHEHLLAFYDDESKAHDDSLSVGPVFEGGQRRRRGRVARVLGGETSLESSLGEEEVPAPSKKKAPMTANERKAALTCATVEDLYKQLEKCYRMADVAKGFLDTLRMEEILHGTRELHLSELVHDDAAGENLSVVGSEDARNEDTVPEGDPKRQTPVAASGWGGASAASSRYELLLARMRLAYQPRFLQHNAISLTTLDFLKKRGIVAMGDQPYVLHLWDDEEVGYLASSVFDRKPGFGKQYKDACTYGIYAGELCGAARTSYSSIELVRQHLAPGARVRFAESGRLHRGCTVIRTAHVLDIIDGRCSGRSQRAVYKDHQRTAIHASIQALAHYTTRFPQWSPLTGLLHPQDNDGHPVVNAVGGMYCLPLIVNGAVRIVKVDDRVPVEPGTEVFRCLTSRAPELYPMLIEKALLKANGCQVNASLTESAAVVFQLCGWVPSTLWFRDNACVGDQMEHHLLWPSETWSILMEDFRTGRIILTLTALWPNGVAPAAPANARGKRKWFVIPVVFPVIDMVVLTRKRKRGGAPLRVLVLRDTTLDAVSDTFTPPIETALTAGQLKKVGLTATLRANGLFCVTWEEALTHFDHCSLNWCPQLYWTSPQRGERRGDGTRLACHGLYDVRMAGRAMTWQPQFHICTHQVGESTRMLLLFCPHTADQKSLPERRKMSVKSAVDEMGMGSTIVRLRVYEVTTRPSVVQYKMQAIHREAVYCSFGECHGCRLTTEAEGPRGEQPIAMGRGSHSEFFTVGFDCLPGSREYVVVLDVLDQHLRLDQQRCFPFTLLLHTSLRPLLEKNVHGLPQYAIHAAHAAEVQTRWAAMHGGFPTDNFLPVKLNVQALLREEAQRRPPPCTATMHAIPEWHNGNFCVVRGRWTLQDAPPVEWSLAHGTTPETLYTGVHYHFHLDTPQRFSLRLCPSKDVSVDLAPVTMRLLLVQRSEGSMTSREACPPTSGDGLVGREEEADDENGINEKGRHRVRRAMHSDVLTGNDLILFTPIASYDGAVLDSVSPHTVRLDRRGLLVSQPERLRQLYHAKLNVVVVDSGDGLNISRSAMQCFFLSQPDPCHQICFVAMHAFADGLLPSPHRCHIGINGRLIPPQTEVHTLLTSPELVYQLHETQSRSCVLTPGTPAAAAPLTLPPPPLEVFMDVEVQNLAPAQYASFPPGSSAAVAVGRLRSVVREALNRPLGHFSPLLRSLTCIMAYIRNCSSSDMDERQQAFLTELAASVEEWMLWHVRSKADGVGAPPLSLPPLPSGDYVVIPCFQTTGRDPGGTPDPFETGADDAAPLFTLYDLTLETSDAVVPLVPVQPPASTEPSGERPPVGHTGYEPSHGEKSKANGDGGGGGVTSRNAREGGTSVAPPASDERIPSFTSTEHNAERGGRRPVARSNGPVEMIRSTEDNPPRRR